MAGQDTFGYPPSGVDRIRRIFQSNIDSRFENNNAAFSRYAAGPDGKTHVSPSSLSSLLTKGGYLSTNILRLTAPFLVIPNSGDPGLRFAPYEMVAIVYDSLAPKIDETDLVPPLTQALNDRMQEQGHDLSHLAQAIGIPVDRVQRFYSLGGWGEIGSHTVEGRRALDECLRLGTYFGSPRDLMRMMERG